MVRIALKTGACSIAQGSRVSCLPRTVPSTVVYQSQAPNASVVVYNSDMLPVADLQDAFRIRFQKKINQVWPAWFYLPFDDVHASKVALLRFAEIYDGTTRVGMFRIINRKVRRLATQKVWWFQCEHVLGTLNDKMLVDAHNAGASGDQTSGAINYILDRQDPVRWKLGTCDWARNFLYRWENKTLLEALLEIPQRFNEDYQWTFDTTSYPWTINLISPSVAVDAYIDYSRNLQEITREEDARELYTRLYAYGQGVQGSADQVSIRSVNPTGEDFIDADTIGTHGIIERVWIDQRYTTAQTLYDAAVERLELRKAPLYYYTVKAADIHRLTGEEIDEFTLGTYVQITDEELGIDISTRLVEISKPDVQGRPGDVTIQLANKMREFTDWTDVYYSPSLDDVTDGGTFARVLSTSISAGEILLSMIAGGALGAFPATPTIAGLYLGASHLGYHDGSNWMTYMDINGNFYLGGTSGSLQWDAENGTLVISGSGLNQTPTTAGLYFNADYMGYWDGDSWEVYIQNDGTFKFAGDADNYLEWDGATLMLVGAMEASGDFQFTHGEDKYGIKGIDYIFFDPAKDTDLQWIMRVGDGLHLYGGTGASAGISLAAPAGAIGLQAAGGDSTRGVYFNLSGTDNDFRVYGAHYYGSQSWPAIYIGYIKIKHKGTERKIPYIA